MQVFSLSQEDPLEKEMATHSIILDWKIPWTEEPSGLQSMGSQRVRNNLVTKLLRMDAQFICLIFFNCHIESRKQKHNITNIQTENSISENTAVISEDMGSL